MLLAIKKLLVLAEYYAPSLFSVLQSAADCNGVALALLGGDAASTHTAGMSPSHSSRVMAGVFQMTTSVPSCLPYKGLLLRPCPDFTACSKSLGSPPLTSKQGDTSALTPEHIVCGCVR